MSNMRVYLLKEEAKGKEWVNWMGVIDARTRGGVWASPSAEKNNKLVHLFE